MQQAHLEPGGAVPDLGADRRAEDLSWPSPAFAAEASQELCWLPKHGYGYLEVRGEHYDQAYIDHYAALADTQIGRQLNSFRTDLVNAHCGVIGSLIDVGVGDGAFLRMLAGRKLTHLRLRGFDVAPPAIAWLEQNRLWGNLYDGPWTYATFWDSLEHIRDPRRALAQVECKAIVSLPIFKGGEHARWSKHFKRAEHYWYFTRQGFVDFVMQQGFHVDHWADNETRLGREDIETFVIRRA